MRVAHFVTIDYGGAYRAAVRIHSAMQEQGCDSILCCRTISDRAHTGVELVSTKTQKLISKAKNGLNLLLSSGDVVIDQFGTEICSKKEFQEADIVVLHWINSFISVSEVSRLAKQGKPIMWVMHDMWPFTGGCHYDKYCRKYESSCGRCPIIKSKIEKDKTYYALRKKCDSYRKQGIVFVSPSRWLQDCAKKSTILRGEKIIRITNPISVDIYKNRGKSEARKRWEISTSKKVILFGAVNATQDSNKGYYSLMKALDQLDKTKYAIVVFGNDKEILDDHGFDMKAVGVVNDEIMLSYLYSAADVFVAPSDQDNYPNTVLEALSCETPVTAFNIGGMPDLIEHERSGYLANFRDPVDLAQGIEYCAEHCSELGAYARYTVMKNNSYDVVGKSYVELCRKMLKNEIAREEGGSDS